MTVAAQSDILTVFGLSAINNLAQWAWTQAEQHVKDFLGWQEIEQQTWVEYYPREPGIAQVNDPHYVLASDRQTAIPQSYLAPDLVQLQQLPVRSITEVREDPTGYFGQVEGAFGDGSILTAGTNYYLKTEQDGICWTGHLIRRGYLFPATMGSLKVTYVAGFTAAELSGRWSVFKTAVVETAADLYLRGKAIAGGQFPGIASEGLGGGATVSYVNEHLCGLEVPDGVAAKLHKYVNLAGDAY